ncbi:hypothetical protein WDA79_03980 [Streptomyces sp. A475]|uniref:hypothetical protein n=1 Tax=Streptomyces sp. A475 TaxID=3131976 RepID=UPI0030C93AA6
MNRHRLTFAMSSHEGDRPGGVPCDAVALLACLLAVQDFGLGLQMSSALDGLARPDGQVVGILDQIAAMCTTRAAGGRTFWGRGRGA